MLSIHKGETQQTTEEFQFHYLKVAQIHAFFFRIVRNSACFYDFGFNYGNPDLLYFLKIAPVNYCISSLTRTLISDKTSDSGLVAHSIRCWSGPPPPSFSVRFQADRPEAPNMWDLHVRYTSVQDFLYFWFKKGFCGGWDIKNLFIRVSAGTVIDRCGEGRGCTFETYNLAVTRRLASPFDRLFRHVSLPPPFPHFKLSFHTLKPSLKL